MVLDPLINLGVSDNMSLEDSRHIRLSNTLTLMLIFSSVIIGSILWIEYGPQLITLQVLGMAPLFAIIYWLTYLGYNKASRIFITIVTPLAVFITTISIKFNNPDLVSEYSYFNARTVLLAATVVPLVVFSYKEIFYIYFGLAISAILVLFFDPIHDMLGIGYNDLLGPPKRAYFISGVYYSMAYFFIAGVFLFFKRSNNKLFRKSVDLIAELNESNTNLASLVDEKTEKLKASNEELISHNSELQHFSNTVSHNLRGPVANIIGLANLFELEKDEHSRAELTRHIKSSAESLDDTLKDLNKIIDIRNHLYQIKEIVIFSEEFNKVKEVLQGKINSYDAKISVNFKDDSLYCIRSYMNSIMYNLLSNALKYRDSSRTCEITVSTYAENGNIILEVEDNGVGLDLEKYGHRIFGMYKRFHDHVDGKGLGLFLTKEQVESLSGKITLESTPGVGTKFRVTCPKPKIELISEQVYFESDAVTIWFDAVNFISTLVWKKEPSSEEYKEGLSRNLEIFRTYKCYGCIADVRKLGMVNETDRNWFINNILADALEIGMKKFIVVHESNDGKDDEYFEGMREAVESHGIFFDHNSYTMEEAKNVIRSIDVK